MDTSNIDSKLDKLLEEVATIKVISSVHTSELQELKEKLEPVFFHVTGMQWMIKVLGSLLGVLACVATVLALWK